MSRAEVWKRKPKYYSGPDGIFYDTKHDAIFELESTGAKICNWKKREIYGNVYFYRTTQSKVRRLAVTGMDNNIVHLGDL